MEVKYKVCTKCGERKQLSEFHKNTHSKDGYRPDCAICKSKHNRTKEQAKVWHDTHIENHLITTARYRAKKKGIEFSLTIDDLKMPEYCPLLGIKLERGTRKNKNAAPSIDRIDNSQGYTPENIWIISFLANCIKHTGTPEQIILVGEGLRKVLDERFMRHVR